jgi:hypothetical protein
VEPRRSLGWPITLGVVLISSIITLGVGWVLVSISAALGSQNAAFYWALLAVGVSLLILVLGRRHHLLCSGSQGNCSVSAAK